MNLKNLREQLIKSEGLKLKPYTDTVGKLTIGIGRNLTDKGITKNEAHYLCDNDIFECMNDLYSIFFNFGFFSENRQHALMEMRFNLGHKGFRTFKKMIQAIRDNDWLEAEIQALDSKWATQVKGRAKRIAKILRSG